MMTERGPLIIDWADATYGNHLADVARSSLLIGKAHIPSGKPQFILMKVFREWLHKKYLKHYFRLHPGGLNKYSKWLLVNAAGHLSEGVLEEKSLAVYVRTELRKFFNLPHQNAQTNRGQ